MKKHKLSNSKAASALWKELEKKDANKPKEFKPVRAEDHLLAQQRYKSSITKNKKKEIPRHQKYKEY